ncbi:type 1 glutamine amidotransferase domain-containing protein [Marinobacter xestospongiae]|uniref:Type 1 glutamine amidotransferase domain-containing protein n=1 Tax=Marinobacter xestospongiae TaxID=994319 RepID=A0ABU3W3R1_9GAMM|nr:type 1 glutamine amidotransferase domain-containing protein [Marinobacter xestospongiae]MDV2081159.1 type 1 glutamine amidotransferase domain-containing protein [Marinobacter xestospongiae]
MKKVLIFVTNHATLGETGEPNGTFAPELTHALKEILNAGFDYDLVSINGGKAPLYGTDIEGDEVNREILADDAFQNRINNTLPVSAVRVEDYDAIFYPGGFGLLSDLATNDAVARLSAQHYEGGGVLAAVCHGPAGLLPITLSNGEKLLASKAVTGFTREEEVDYGTLDKIPFLLEEALARTARRYSKVQPWQELVVEDDRVITGQNPASAHAVGAALVQRLA